MCVYTVIYVYIIYVYIYLYPQYMKDTREVALI